VRFHLIVIRSSLAGGETAAVRDEMRDVAILGAGVAGLTAAYRLRGLDVEVLEAANHVGGRTLSQSFEDGTWANFAAQYVSDDKVTLIALADELGLELVPSGFHSDEFRALDPRSNSAVDEIEGWIAKLEAEQARPRPPDTPELDQVSVAQWLQDASEPVKAFFEVWCGSLMFASITEVSLYGLMLLWGDNRTSAFTTPPVPRSERGDTVFRGGTNELTKALGRASGATLTTGATVTRVEAHGDGYRVFYEHRGRLLSLAARQVICALPAPVARDVIAGLPDDKAAALAAIRYGRTIATPISIAPAGQRAEPPKLVPSRPGQTYNANGFVLRTPGDMERDGGCFHSYVYDVFARPLWDDPPETIQSGAIRALIARFPQFSDRILRVGFARWRYGLPHYSPGRMAHQTALEASVGGIHFCGDYVVTANMDGAARSGELAARRVQER